MTPTNAASPTPMRKPTIQNLTDSLKTLASGMSISVTLTASGSFDSFNDSTLQN